MCLSFELLRVVVTVSAVILTNINNVVSTTFDCDNEFDPCDGSHVCADNENCHIMCTEYLACYLGAFLCPADGISNCTVTTNAGSAMELSEVYGRQSFKLSVIVTGNDNSPFDDGYVSCPTNGLCDINVYANQGCAGTDIVSGTNSTIEIYSSGARSFANSLIDARDGLSLKLTSDVIAFSFADTRIYCPINNNSNDDYGNYNYSCVLLGIDASTYEHSDIYAVNGLKDILFGEYKIDMNDDIMLHCDYDYSNSCRLYYDNITQANRCNQTYCDYGKFSQC